MTTLNEWIDLAGELNEAPLTMSQLDRLLDTWNEEPENMAMYYAEAKRQKTDMKLIKIYIDNVEVGEMTTHKNEEEDAIVARFSSVMDLFEEETGKNIVDFEFELGSSEIRAWSEPEEED